MVTTKLTLGFNEVKKQSQKIPYWVYVIFVVLALIKLWLVQGQTVNAWGNATHDDRLYLQLANWLLQGKWLGPYDNMTLVIGPFYPFWIGFSFILGVPLLFSEHLLYIAACIVLVMAVTPLFSRSIHLIFLFSVLLFNPASFADGIMTRVHRMGIYPALTLLVLALSIGLLLRNGSVSRKLWVWAVGLGLILGAFWITREEGVWLVPVIVVIYSFALFGLLKERQPKWRLQIVIWVIPLLVGGLIILAIPVINYYRYGIFTEIELNDPDFKAAYGALTRVKPLNWRPLVPVAKETRLRIYSVSPSFAELQPYLEGAIGKAYNVESLGDMNGGGFIYAFRDAIQMKGYYNSGKFPREFYQRLANEINNACMEGKLDCISQRKSLLPPWRISYLRPWVTEFFHSIVYTISLKDLYANPSPSRGSEEELHLFQDLTLGRLADPKQKKLNISGWGFKEGSPLNYLVRANNGDLADMDIEYSSSMDIYDFFVNKGIVDVNAKQARFTILTSCIRNCSLEVWESGNLITSLLIDDGVLTPGSKSSGPLYFYIESSNLISPSTYTPLQVKSDNFKISILNRLIKIFQVIVPVLAAMALLSYVLLSILLILRKTVLLEWFFLTVILLAYGCRLAIISLVSVTSWAASNFLYFSPAYPLFILFISSSLIFGFEYIYPGLVNIKSANLVKER